MNKLSTTELRAMLAGITPGPWEAKFQPFAPSHHVGKRAPNGSLDLICSLRDSVPQTTEREANARSIAQVPALLAEVLALREALANMLKQATFYRRCNEQARNLPDEEGPIERQARNALKWAE